MSPQKKERIFISYKRVDKERVFAIKDGIEQATGEKCWIDLDGIESDAQFADVIISAINRCEVFLFMYSASHTKIVNRKKDWTIREISFAEKKDKRIVFVNIDNSPLTDWFELNFGTTQQVDATDTEKLARLHNDLCSWLKIDFRKIQQDSYKDASKAEQDRLRKERELQERMAQAEAEEQEKEMIEEPDFIESAEILNNESQESSSKSFKKTGLKKILKIAVLSLAGIMLIFGTILAIARRTLRYEYDYSNRTATVIQRMPIFRYSGNINIPKIIKHKGECFQVTSIGSYAFSYCSGLTSITIPKSVTSIGEYAFLNCSGLTTIIVEKGNTTYDSRENCNAIIETAKNTLIAGCKNTFIPNSVTSIGEVAFYGYKGLTSITIPNSVTRIGNGAFYGCKGLTSITIPNSVTSIGSYAFKYCSGLTSITIPNSVSSIGDGAFEGCSGLTSITIPNSLTSIGSETFLNCSGLTSITIPNSVTSIGYKAFYGCSSLKSIKIPKGLTNFGFYAFPEHTQVIYE